MQLFREYILERQGLSLIEKPWGFLSYRIKDQECLLSDIFVQKEVRRSGLGKELILELIKKAQQEACDFVSARIYLSDPNCNSTLKAALAFGFNVMQSSDGILVLIKIIKG